MARKKSRAVHLQRPLPPVPSLSSPPVRRITVAASLLGAWLACLVIVVAGLAVYANNLEGEFIFDDYDAIIDNPDIQSLHSLKPILRPTPDGSPLAARPVPALSIAINYAFGGLDVRGYHLVNNAIHVLAALALFGLLRSTLLLPRFAARYATLANGLALAVALLWLLHPLQTEAVSYVTQRTETLMALFYLTTLFCASTGFRAVRRKRWYVASVAACLLGMASKEVMVSAPLMVLLYDHLFVTGSWRRALRQRWLFYGLLAATWGVVIFYQLNNPRADSVLFHSQALSVPDYLRTQLTIIVHYLALAFWPHPLVLDGQDWPIVRGVTAPLLLAITILGSMVGLTLWGLARASWWSFLGVWFFAILAPSSSVIPIITEIFAERRMYLPLAAVIAFVVFVADEVWRRVRCRVSSASKWVSLVPGLLVAILALVFAILTWNRNQEYRTEVTIWADTVAKRPGNTRAQENLGKALVKEKRFAEAIFHLQESLRLTTDEGHDPELYSNLGSAYSQLGRFDEAIAMHQKAIALRPNDPLDHYHLGNSYLRVNDLAKAAIAFTRAIAINPNLSPAHGNLGMVLMQQGDLVGAEVELQALLQLAPDNPSSFTMLAELRERQGRFAEAATLYRQALHLAPGASDIGSRLEALLAAHPEAVENR